VLAPQDSPGHPLAPWFHYWRELRAWERRARAKARGGRPPARRTRAIITIVHNESVFLPIWLRYYSRFFGADDIYVLDNESTDGSTDRGGFVRIPVEHDKVDHVWMLETMQDLQHELLDRYDLVVVTDVDEIIAPVPELSSLGRYLDHFDAEYMNCLGYELLHMKDLELPLDLSSPILGQRRFWFANAGYNKPAVATIPMEWAPGFHVRADLQASIDPDLRLIHLHRMDYEICRERHRVRRRKAWAGEDEERSWAVHNKLAEGAEFEEWFYNESGWKGFPPQPEEMRSSWWGVF
jgi:Glycosyl transferase family 2